MTLLNHQIQAILSGFWPWVNRTVESFLFIQTNLLPQEHIVVVEFMRRKLAFVSRWESLCGICRFSLRIEAFKSQNSQAAHFRSMGCLEKHTSEIFRRWFRHDMG